MFSKLRLYVRSSCIAAALLAHALSAAGYDLHYDYTSFDNPGTPGISPHFGQNQFNVLNYPSINGNYMMTSSDAHRPEMVASNNNLAQFYNSFLADYNTQFNAGNINAVAEADAINAYTVSRSTSNGPKPTWLVLNEISTSLWQQSPGAPSQSVYRQWVVDCVTRLHDVYGFSVITYSPFATVSTQSAASWQAVAAKSYVAIENYLSGQEVLAGGANYASRVAWAQSQYQASVNTYTAAGVDRSLLFLSEHFGNTISSVGFGRAGVSATDWDAVIQIRQDAIYNVGFDGFLAYSWGSNTMLVTEAEQIQHEYYYRSRLVLPSQKPQWLSDAAPNVNGTVIPLSWSQPLNWLGGVPNTAGVEANFWRTLTAPRTITLDGSKTVGELTFDSAFSYTISAGSGGSLLLNNSGSAAQITSSQGNHTIGVDVQLANGLEAVITAGSLTVTGNVSGTGGVTKSGASALALNGTNSYSGDTKVQNGTLSLAIASLSDGADVYLATGTTLDLKFSGSPDVVDSLFINGVSQVPGIWGAVGTGAALTSALITGSGFLQVTTFVPTTVLGDYNQDGTVDAADYVLWRDRMGSATALPNDDTPGVGLDDYDRWRSHFGQVAASGATGRFPSVDSGAVPEPSAVFLWLTGQLAMTLGWRRRELSADGWYLQLGRAHD